MNYEQDNQSSWTYDEQPESRTEPQPRYQPEPVSEPAPEIPQTPETPVETEPQTFEENFVAPANPNG